MKIQEQIQIIEDNLKEYGQCNITIDEFNYLKDELYSSGCLAGIELGRADAFDEAIAYFEIHAHEVYNHISARDFICDRLEQLKE